MANSKRLLRQGVSPGDLAVDGLIAGIVAGAAMLVYLLGASVIEGERLGIVLSRFDPSESATPATGLLLHLGVAAVHGMVFTLGYGLIVGRLWPGVRIWLLGLGYGLVALALAYYVILPGAGSRLLELPVVHLGVAHVLYGAVVGLVVGRKLAPESGSERQSSTRS